VFWFPGFSLAFEVGDVVRRELHEPGGGNIMSKKELLQRLTQYAIRISDPENWTIEELSGELDKAQRLCPAGGHPGLSLVRGRARPTMRS